MLRREVAFYVPMWIIFKANLKIETGTVICTALDVIEVFIHQVLQLYILHTVCEYLSSPIVLVRLVPTCLLQYPCEWDPLCQ